MRRSRLLAVVLLALVAIGIAIVSRSNRAERRNEPATAPAASSGAAHESEAPDLAVAPATSEHTPSPRAAVETPSVPEESEGTSEDPPSTPAAPGVDEGLLQVEVRSKDTGLPLPGIRVSLWCDLWDYDDAVVRLSTQSDPARGVEGDDVTTRADGTAELIVPSGVAYLVRSWSQDEKAGDVELPTEALEPGEERQVLLELPTAYDVHFRGRIVDAVSGIRLAGAKVRLLSGSDTVEGRPTEVEELAATESAADGSFELVAPSWRNRSGRIECEGYSPVSIRIGRGHETLETEREVRLPRAGTLEVILSGLDRRPGAVGRLRLRSDPKDPEDLRRSGWVDDRMGPQTIAWDVRASPDGVAILDGLPVGTELYIKAEVRVGENRIHYSVDTLILEPGEVRTLVIPLGSHAVSGRVVDAQSAVVPDLDLWLIQGDYDGRHLSGENRMSVSATAKSDGEGRFVFDALAPGTWSIGPAPGGARYGPREDGIAAVLTHFTIPEAGDATLELRVHRDLYIRGRVLDVDGKVPRECRVTCNVPLGQEIECTIEDDGTFRIGPLAPGSYSLDAEPDRNWNEGSDWLAFRTGSESVVAEAGAENVTLRLRPAGVISGRIERNDEEDPADVDLELFGGSPPRERWAGDVAHDGTFSVGSLEPGVYAFTAVTGDDLVATASGVQVGPLETTSGIVLRPVAGARIMIDFDPDPERDAATGRVPVRSIDVVCNGVEMHETWVQEDIEVVVPAGDLLLRIRRWDSVLELEQSFTLAAGEEKTVVFRP